MTNQPTTQFLSRPEGRIAYDLQGNGPLVVLVPGMGDLRSAYRFLAPELAAAGYRVATTDLRGHGDSDATFSSYGDADTANDLEALVSALGEPATLVGNSMAAGAAVIVAARRPELVTGLALVGPFVRNPPSNGVQMALFRAMMSRPWIAAAWKAYLPTLYAGTKPTDFAAYRDTVIASIKRPGYARAFALTTRLTHAPAEASLPAVTAPTLVVMGENDPDFTDPRGEADWIADTLHGTAVMIPDAGHYPQSQRPELVASAVLDFLATVTHRA